MCKLLEISRSTVYYNSQDQVNSDNEVERKIIEIFKKNRNHYVTRKIKKELKVYCFKTQDITNYEETRSSRTRAI